MAAFERCNALEKENIELRQAMHTFAEGSASATIQQLQKIVASLTEEVSQYKRREEDIKAKELSLRNKENNSIIKAMRKQTRELKVGLDTCNGDGRMLKPCAKRRSLQKTLDMKTPATKELDEVKEVKEPKTKDGKEISVLGSKNVNANNAAFSSARPAAGSPELVSAHASHRYLETNVRLACYSYVPRGLLPVTRAPTGPVNEIYLG